MTTATLDRIGLVTSALFRAVSVIAWAAAIPEVSGYTKAAWLVAGALWWVQDIAATVVVRRQREERRARERETELAVIAGMERVMGVHGGKAPN